MANHNLGRQKTFSEINQDIWLLRQCNFDARISPKKWEEHIKRVKLQRLSANEEMYGSRLNSVMDAIDQCLATLQENLYKAIAIETQKKVQQQIRTIRKQRKQQLVFPEFLEVGSFAS